MLSVFLMTGIVTVAALTFLLECRRRARFNELFPPIDDTEFVRRCGPGIRPDVALRVRRIVSDQLGVDYDRIYPEQSFVNDLDCC